MNLERELTYVGKKELGEYLEGNLLNKELYKAYLGIKDNGYRWKHSAVETFNEVYYQCTRVYNDPNPEEEVYVNYLNNARDDMGTRYASDMIFAMVNAIFEIMDNRPDNVEFFMAELKPHLKNDTLYYQPFEDFANSFINSYGKQSMHFPYSPMDLENFYFYGTPLWSESSDWKKATHDFDEYWIRKYIGRYPKKEDKLKLLDLIKEAYKTCIKNEEENSFNLPF